MFNDRRSAPERGAKKGREGFGLSLIEDARKPVTEQRGSDPYNTSGSFDRKKNWARIGKR